VGVPKPVHRLNEYDEHGSLVSLVRNRGETNWSYKRRIADVFVNVANSSYRGLVNGVTRELGLNLLEAIDINPKVDSNNDFLAPDPYIKFDGVYLYLYSDYTNGLLDWTIDRFEVGGNYEHLGRLVDFINTTYFFEASMRAGTDQYTRSMTILNQSNRDQVSMEFVSQSTRFNLKHNKLVPGTVFFSNRNTFATQVGSAAAVSTRGDFYINHASGVVTVATIPNPKEYVRYQYAKYPFYAVASPVILHDINSDNFKAKMFEQVLQDDGTYANGLPTELGADIINELMSVSPMYWGV
jgi:hypothetical protein